MALHTGMISENFSWHEVEFSDTAERLGIDNSLPKEMEWIAAKTALQMEKVRLVLDSPVSVDSWYRCPRLQLEPAFYNPTSQHPKAEAVDFVSPKFGIPVQICKKILASGIIVFDQLILEHSWVHISFNSVPGGLQKKQVLSLLATKNYAIGLTDIYGKPL